MATPTIFIQIAAYRDPECAPTIADAFARAAHPDRVRVGVCWQYKDGVEQATLGIPFAFAAQVHVDAVSAAQSEGPSWAKRRAQGFYQGETYILMIDSHMRFVDGWDEKMIAEWKACGNIKAVLTAHPPTYIPPRTIPGDAMLTVLRAHPPTAGGDIRIRGERLAKTPKAPLKGAFAAPGFLFARGELAVEVPYDPYLYFEQEEMCLAARLYTHGWEVYHPSVILLYHLYDSTPVPFARHKHWNDNVGWQALNQRARKRKDHLLGIAFSEEEPVIAELDAYGHGDARSLEEFQTFCGIDFGKGVMEAKAVTAGFIAGVEALLEHPVDAQSLLSPVVAAPERGLANAPKPSGDAPAKLPSAFTGVPMTAFTPVTTDIVQHINAARYFDAPAKAVDEVPVLETNVPAGVLMVKHFLPRWACQQLMDYADKTVGRKLEVVDHDRSSRETVATVVSSGRITDHVPINAVSGEILPLFIDIYSKRLAPFYGVDFEWFERPQILRYSAGGKYDPHADAEHMNPQSREWFRSQDRDISVLLYLNDEYEGGELAFDSLHYSFKPEAGMLLAFPSDHRYLHAARPTLSGTRYVIVSWAATLGTPRVKASAPYASVFLNVRNG